MKELDCRGLPCPQPVINTKNVLEEISEGEKFAVLVDNEAAVTNVTRFAEAQGHEVSVEEKERFWRLIVTKKGPGRPTGPVTCERPEGLPAVVVIDREGMGEGDKTLSQILMRAFLKTLKDVSNKPSTIIFYNSGIFLTLEGSEVLETIKELEQEGIKILVCGTCLDFYQAKNRLAVGQISNMYDIVETISRAGLVIKP